MVPLFLLVESPFLLAKCHKLVAPPSDAKVTCYSWVLWVETTGNRHGSPAMTLTSGVWSQSLLKKKKHLTLW